MIFEGLGGETDELALLAADSRANGAGAARRGIELRSQGVADAGDVDGDVCVSRWARDRIESGAQGSARRLELYQSAQLDKAAVQFQNSMQMAPAFAPSRLYLGVALAEGNRHKEAARAP